MKKTALFLSGLLFLFSCGNGVKSEKGELNTDVVANPATADKSDADAAEVAVPEFSFETETHDFGTIIQGEKVAYAFKFTNTGKGDLIIASAKGSCGCTIPEYPVEPIPPGGTGVIDVIFNSAGKSGQQRKKVTIVSNTVPNTKVLSINGMVEVPVKDK